MIWLNTGSKKPASRMRNLKTGEGDPVANGTGPEGIALVRRRPAPEFMALMERSMSHKLRSTAAAVLATLALAGCQGVGQQAAAPNTLVAVKVAAAPNMNALAADAAWAQAKPLAVSLSDGANFVKGETSGTLKAVYTGDTLYMLVQYKDPTDSVRRGPYQKQADGSWKQLKDPANKGGDDNVYYEDKWAMLWSINNSIKGFEDQGCAVTCHLGQGKPYGNKYTSKPGELGDIWHAKGQRTIPVGLVDDQYVDDTRYDPQKSPNAGRKNEDAQGDYTPIKLVNGKPEFMVKSGKAANAGGGYGIRRGEEVAFVDNFKAGDEVASFFMNGLKGDRADVKVAQKWENGVITAVASRKLVTGSKFDVQFSNLSARYPFGFAAFDNAQVRHATTDDALFLVFGK